MEQLRIHIICQKPEICSLIKKSFKSEDFNITCTEDENSFESQYLETNDKIDCLILDRGLSKGVSDKVKERLKNVSLIFLPSLEPEENDFLQGGENISEPLKLSELSEKVQNILNQKRN